VLYGSAGEVLTESVVDEVIEGVAVAVVGEFIVGGRELLEALKSDGVEVAAEFGVLRKNHGAARDERVDQRSLVLVVSHRLLPDLSAVRTLSTYTLFFFFPFLFFSFPFFLERECRKEEK